MIIYCLVKYGYHGRFALISCINAESEKRKWKEYTANCIGAITQRIFRWSGAENFELPLYSELDKPKLPKLSAAEIKQHVIAALSE